MSDGEDPRANDAAAKRREEHKRFSENHYNRAQTLAAWLLATLVAINSTAAAAILTAGKGAERQPAIAFAIGVMLAVMSGLLTWAEANDRAGLHFLRSEAESANEADGKFERWTKRGTVLAELAIGVNVLALLAFAYGCLWTAQVLPANS